MCIIGASVCYSKCHCLSFDVLFASFRMSGWPSARKEPSSRQSACVVLYLMPSLVFVFLSRLVSWAGCGIRIEPRHEKTCLRGFRPGKRLEISDIETRDIILSRQRRTNALIRLRGCAG